MRNLTIGLETHVELSTKTKIFCSCSTSFGAAPNSHCCPVCTGMPGALPSLNKRVVEFAIRAGLATHSKISECFEMARKNYTYPDLPKAYQISEAAKPVCTDGYLTLSSGKRIRIERIHIEEDAGKLVHEGDLTQIDYNRCGVPLIEIVTKPDFSSGEEVKEYLERIQILMRYLGISDCKMQEGSMRSDVNVSLSDGEVLGTRVEIKNMGSPTFIMKAIAFEEKRQRALLENGENIEAETRRYREKDASTVKMRGKEDAEDYRYFPEPDLPPVRVERSWVEGLTLPELPDEKRERYLKLGLSSQTVELIVPYHKVASFFDEVIEKGGSVKTVGNLIVGTIYSTLKTEEEKEAFSVLVEAKELAILSSYVDAKKISVGKASSVLIKMLETGKGVSAFLTESDLVSLTEEELRAVCVLAVKENQKAVSDFLSGKEKAIFSLVGAVMKATKGKADSKKAEEILREIVKNG